MTCVPVMGMFVPNMGNTIDTIARALFGETRISVLTALFVDPEESLHVAELIRRANAGRGAVQRELTRLNAAGILMREERGNQVLYRPDPSCPVFPEIRSLVLKTTGLADALRAALEPLADVIEWAFVFGSMASGQSTTASDVDLMIVGSASDRSLHMALADVEKTIGRDINYHILTPEELRERLQEEGFVARVVSGPRIDVIGALVDV